MSEETESTGRHHPLYAVLGKVLAEKRDRANMRIAAMSARLGVVRSAITHWEKGDHRIAMHHYVQYCRAAGVKPGVLLDRLLAQNPDLFGKKK